MCISYLLRFRQIEDFLKANGWKTVDSPEEADLTVIGACAAFLPYFRRYAEHVARVSESSRLVVYGCLPTVNRDFYQANTPDNATFIHTRHPERLETVVREMQGGLDLPWNQIPVPTQFRLQDYSEYTPRRRFVLIQEGCSEKCSYCPHRIGIGRERSRPADAIVAEVLSAVASGADWIVLEGNNSGSWGLDFAPPQTFPVLMEAIWALDGDFEVHIGDFAPRWVERYGDVLLPQRITDAKIPIQTTSARLLELMGRTPYVADMAPLLKKLRRRKPGMVLRTEIIIGFPTETEAELLDTLTFVAEHFDRVGCFSFDLHPHTKAARMGLDLMDDETISHHIRIAMDFFAYKPGIAAAFDDRGRVMAALTNGKSPA
jgi:tRNA A37 methylthiotransferase MiaB